MSVLDTHPTSTVRRSIGPGVAAIAIAAPVVLLASELVAPRSPDGLSDKQDLAWLLEHHQRLQLSWLIGLVAAALFAAAFVLVADRLRGRGRTLARIAGALGLTGAIGLAGHMAISLATRDIGLDDPSAVRAVASAEDGLGAVATVAPVIIGLDLAIVLISIAAVMAGLAPRWAIVLGVGAFAADWSPTSWNTVLAAVLITVLFALITRPSGHSASGQGAHDSR